MCFMMDPNLGKNVCYVQFPQRFDGIDKNDRYANRNTVFFDVSILHRTHQHNDLLFARMFLCYFTYIDITFFVILISTTCLFLNR